MKETPLSRNEREFVRDALLAGARVDGRGMFDYRKVAVSFGLARGHVEVAVGGTKVLAQTSCEVRRCLPFSCRELPPPPPPVSSHRLLSVVL